MVSQVAEAAEAAFIVALDGTVVSWNAAAAELFGIPRWQAIGAPCPSLVRGRTAQGQVVCCAGCSVLQIAASGRSASPMDLSVPARRGAGRRTLRVHVVTLKDQDGQPRAVLHLVEDVDEQRRRERIGERFLLLTEERQTGERAPCAALTPRELEVLRLVAEGQTAREVAQRLGIRYTTARTHIQRILSKLGAHNRVAALARALETGEPGAEAAS